MKVGGDRDGRPWVPRFCILRAEEGRGSSWLRAEAGPGVLPLAPDPESRRQDAVHVGLARGEVAGPREEYFRGDDTVLLGPYCQNSGLGAQCQYLSAESTFRRSHHARQAFRSESCKSVQRRPVLVADPSAQAGEELSRLLALITKLRSPDGCPGIGNKPSTAIRGPRLDRRTRLARPLRRARRPPAPTRLLRPNRLRRRAPRHRPCRQGTKKGHPQGWPKVPQSEKNYSY